MSATQGVPNHPQASDVNKGDAPLSGDGSGNAPTGKPDPPTRLAGDGDTIRDTNLLEGVGAGARVWATYIQEANKYDNELVGGWNRDLDVTLANGWGVLLPTVFAALFSTVVTAFVFESVKLLQPDLDSANAAALIDISQVLRRMAAGQPPVLEQPGVPAITEFRPTGYSLCINVLFFSSLSLSVAVSLAAMVAKQWCYYFVSGRTGDSIQQVEVRQERFNQIQRWKMGGILEMLPVLMHLSLCIFWVGVVLYMWDIHVGVAVAVTTIAGVTMCFYFGTMLLPIVVKHCPFITPQGEWIGTMIKNLGAPIAQPIGSFASTCTHKFRRPLSDPHMLGNGSQLGRLPTRVARWIFSVAHTQSPDIGGDIRSGGTNGRLKLARICSINRPNRGDESVAATAAQIVLPTEHQGQEIEGQVLSNELNRPFIGDSLLWLIRNSRDSAVIDVAIGALVIGKIDIQTIRTKEYDFKRQISSYLAKRLSECFESHKDPGAQLVRPVGGMSLSSALEYSRWMSYFAGPNLGEIKREILDLHDTLGVELIAHLGLAFASLGESQRLSDDDRAKIAMWLSVFIDLYDEKRLFTKRAISVIIDGLTAASLKLDVPSGADTAVRRKLTDNAGIPHLVRILSEVSTTQDPQDAQMQSSIVLNLAVFALRANSAGPFAHEGLDWIAALAVEYHRARMPLPQNEMYAPLAAFSLIGLIHPESGLGLEHDTVITISKLIKKLDFFRHVPHYTGGSICHFTSPDSFWQYMAEMLVGAMVLTRSTCDSPLHQSFGEPAITPAALLQLTSTSYQSSSWRGDLLFSSTLHAVCKLMHDHLHRDIILYPEVLVATTSLLLRQIKELKNFTLDYNILFPPRGLTTSPILELSDFTESQSGEERAIFLANVTLERIMEKPEDPRCFEAVVQVIIHHAHGCGVGTIATAIAWVADGFNIPSEEMEGNELLRVSGYARVLTSMIRHSPDLMTLSSHIENLVGNGSQGKDWARRIEHVRMILDHLSRVEVADGHIPVFGISGLAVWKHYISSPSLDVWNPNHSELTTLDLLNKTWNMVEKHSFNTNQLQPEAIEALIETTVHLAAFTDDVYKLTARNTQMILELLTRFSSQSGARLKSTIAVAVTYWGLSLEEPSWKFWTDQNRKVYWERYRGSTARKKDTAALLLIGLSRILAHYSTLQLSHASIKTIAHEIHSHMSAHSGDSYNLALDFLSPGLTFDVRRHVRESVWQYLEETERYKPFSRSTNDVRELLRTAVAYDGGEGYGYETPQPFIRPTNLEEEKEIAAT